jgi:hypothetical protein
MTLEMARVHAEMKPMNASQQERPSIADALMSQLD